MGGWGVTCNLCGFAGEAGEVDAPGTVWVSCWVGTQEVVQLVRMLSGASVIDDMVDMMGAGAPTQAVDWFRCRGNLSVPGALTHSKHNSRFSDASHISPSTTPPTPTPNPRTDSSTRIIAVCSSAHLRGNNYQHKKSNY